ncbi:hypothetical protein GFS24_17695 [Chitinophaga sp. SYP-B3965]|uniref:hypothetical protein n=1 Tax=Chitinophaga sp. SYP-B3965 TaxID=2663120 RepID=UPI001299948F|nr:hypothetical protein [Chitinophaga sp. SYP-B3965]MRG46960.1 hypothetical protein [Chitinophaga sp. SYP-B3965]
MKTIHFILIIALPIFSINTAYSQVEENRNEKLVRGFLKSIQTPNWNFDTLSNRYILFRSDESPQFSKTERKVIISFALTYLSMELNTVKFDELIIRPYLKADSSLQKMFLDEETKRKSVIAYSKDKLFKRYFLLEDGKIISFVTFQQGKVFMLLN